MDMIDLWLIADDQRHVLMTSGATDIYRLLPLAEVNKHKDKSLAEYDQWPVAHVP